MLCLFPFMLCSNNSSSARIVSYHVFSDRGNSYGITLSINPEESSSAPGLSG